jgi:hypothetical protein
MAWFGWKKKKTVSKLPTTPEIKEMIQLCIDSYTNLGGFYNKEYLTKYKYESSYSERCEYSEYYNQVKGIVDSIVNGVFSNPITRSDLNDYEEAYVKDVDGCGTDMTTFLAEIGVYHELLGNVFIITDNNKENPENQQEAIKKRLFPYNYYKLGNEVAGYKLNSDGCLSEISFYHKTIIVNGTPKTLYRHIDENYTYIYSLSNEKQVIEGEKLESATDGLPVIMTGTKVLPVPPMYSLAAQAKVVFNKGSELRYIERATNIPILQLIGAPDKNVIIKNVVWIPESANKEVKWINPDANIMAQTLANAQAAADDLEKIGKSFGATPIAESKTVKSGMSYAFEFTSTDDAKSALALVFEKIEPKMFESFASFFTWETKAVVEYDKNYAPGQAQMLAQLDILKGAVDRFISLTATREFNKRIVIIVNELGGVKLDGKTINQINKEIDESFDLLTLQKMTDIATDLGSQDQIIEALAHIMGIVFDGEPILIEKKEELEGDE